MSETSDIRLCPEPMLEQIAVTLRESDAQARELLDGQLASYPSDARLWMLRGALFASLQHADAAAADFRQAIVLAPALHGARFMLGYLELCQGRAEQALVIWHPLRELDTAMGDFANGLTALVHDRFADARVALAAGLDRNTAPELAPFVHELLDRMSTAAPADGTASDSQESPSHLLLAGYLGQGGRLH